MALRCIQDARLQKVLAWVPHIWCSCAVTACQCHVGLSRTSLFTRSPQIEMRIMQVVPAAAQ